MDEITPLLLAGLSITESELDALFALFLVDTAIDLEIDIKLLSKLYRHARIAKGLKFSIEDFIHAIELRLEGLVVSQLSHILDLIEFKSWLKSSPFSVSELVMILLGRESSSLKYQNDADSAAAAVLEIQESFEAAKQILLNTYLQKTYNLTSEQLENLKESSYTLSEIVTILESEVESATIYANEYAIDSDALPKAMQAIEDSVEPDKIALL
ncbi:MAG: hypothetical protein GY839_03335, partial [candidate division Zixibacteria bacterium]|nr:hypothetical protein [candidate division Zixibacteria bacterium]